MRRSPPADRFYVGYLPSPGAHRGAMRAAVAILLLAFAGLAFAFAASQRDPGDAVWDIVNAQTWEGVVRMDPYPMLVTNGGEALLIVGAVKNGVHATVRPHDGQRRTLTGYPLEREGRRMIQILEAEGEFQPAEGSVATLTAEPIGEVSYLRGEIVDGKCYLGAMKPGDGLAHRACAILCVRGGLPAMFVPADRDAGDPLMLVTVNGAGDMPESMLGSIGMRVSVSGRISRLGSLTVLDVDPGSIIP